MAERGGEIFKVMALLQTILDESDKIDSEPPVEVEPKLDPETVEPEEVSEARYGVGVHCWSC